MTCDFMEKLSRGIDMQETLSCGHTLDRRLNPSTDKMSWCLISPLGIFMGWLGGVKPSLKRIEAFKAECWRLISEDYA